MEARRLCADVDRKDTPSVTFALFFQGLLSTGDLEPETGLRRKGFNRFFAPAEMYLS